VACRPPSVGADEKEVLPPVQYAEFLGGGVTSTGVSPPALAPAFAPLPPLAGSPASGFDGSPHETAPDEEERQREPIRARHHGVRPR